MYGNPEVQATVVILTYWDFLFCFYGSAGEAVKVIVAAVQLITGWRG